MHWFTDRPEQTQGQMPTPIVYVEDDVKFEYKRLQRDLDQEAPPEAEELNTLGADGWGIAGVFTYDSTLTIYLRRVVR